jgi:hypothetical protein
MNGIAITALLGNLIVTAVCMYFKYWHFAVFNGGLVLIILVSEIIRAINSIK